MSLANRNAGRCCFTLPLCTGSISCFTAGLFHRLWPVALLSWGWGCMFPFVPGLIPPQPEPRVFCENLSSPPLICGASSPLRPYLVQSWVCRGTGSLSRGDVLRPRRSRMLEDRRRARLQPTCGLFLEGCVCFRSGPSCLPVGSRVAWITCRLSLPEEKPGPLSETCGRRRSSLCPLSIFSVLMRLPSVCRAVQFLSSQSFFQSPHSEFSALSPLRFGAGFPVSSGILSWSCFMAPGCWNGGC